MEQTKQNEPFKHFVWLPAWAEYAENIKDDAQQLAFNWAVALYGLKCQEPKGIEGDVLRYFNEKVRPELDRQHKQKRKIKMPRL